MKKKPKYSWMAGCAQIVVSKQPKLVRDRNTNVMSPDGFQIKIERLGARKKEVRIKFQIKNKFNLLLEEEVVVVLGLDAPAFFHASRSYD
jgi:hypothetical protein